MDEWYAVYAQWCHIQPEIVFCARWTVWYHLKSEAQGCRGVVIRCKVAHLLHSWHLELPGLWQLPFAAQVGYCRCLGILPVVLFPPGFGIRPDWLDHKWTALSTVGNAAKMHWGHIWDRISSVNSNPSQATLKDQEQYIFIHTKQHHIKVLHHKTSFILFWSLHATVFGHQCEYL